MDSREQFDFWYAVQNTKVIRMPSSPLETFGATNLKYHLVSELLDSVDRVRVREGRIEAFRPEILTPSSFMDSLLEGFGEEAKAYAEWLRRHESNLYILKYGFAVRKREVRDEVLTGNLGDVAERVHAAVKAAEDPLSAVIIGVDKPWEVCLLKLMVDVVQQSAAHNVRDLRRRGVAPAGAGPEAEIEAAFAAAGEDPAVLGPLSDLLQRHRLFERYQDRFFALIRGRGERP